MAHDNDGMLWREAAVECVLDLRATALQEQPTEVVTPDAVSRRVLADDIVAEGDLPAHDHATMDGFAFDVNVDYPLSVVGDEAFPESEPPEIEPGEAIRIATGAPLPERANAVLKREKATVKDGQLTGATIEPGTYVYQRGSNVAAGERLYEAGERLSPKDAILLGDLEIEEITVRTPFSAGVLATGTEIHEDRAKELDSDMLAGLVRSWGHEATDEGTVPDEYDRVRDRISNLADTHDVVITTGGTSVGHKDYIVRALDDLGEVLFHRVRVRPGKPIAVAKLPGAVAFAIPGKPLGAHTIATLVMRPFFTGDTARPTVEATMAVDVDLGPEGFEYAVPVVLEDDRAIPMGHVESPLAVYEETFDPSVVSSSTRATRADGIVTTQSQLRAETTVEVTPYPTLE